MQSIAVNGKIVLIDTNVFASSRDRGAAVDSGTTLVVLAEEAYDPFVNAITAELSSVQSLTYQGFQCFSGISSVVELFPPISFNFEGGASLTVRAQDYLRPIDTLFTIEILMGSSILEPWLTWVFSFFNCHACFKLPISPALIQCLHTYRFSTY
ncbi:hypothetical protein Sjap_008394 [Stephania japonica]|uniref:Peptidase A1 domain-containing protein n=1 Tax=Stephania japonica TaxID=461633 RepID=A0AAP0PEK0_9MAGN